jgi:hypothetical protein
MLPRCGHWRWGVHSQVIVLLFVLMGVAQGEELQAESKDGLYVTAGPLAGGTRLEGEWTSGIGLELSVVSLHERALPAAWGVCGGWFSYTSQPGGRIWLEAEVALARPIPFGLGVGPALEVDKIRPPRFGVQGTLWVFAGVVPYLRAGVLQERGVFGELGIMVKLPLPRVVAW